jgi:hypothetical protein
MNPEALVLPDLVYGHMGPEYYMDRAFRSQGDDSMATKTNDAATTTTDAKPTNKLRKPPMSAYKRIDGQLKRAAVSAKISKDELTKISELATALTHFAE